MSRHRDSLEAAREDRELFIVRHGERIDEVDSNWTSQAQSPL